MGVKEGRRKKEEGRSKNWEVTRAKVQDGRGKTEGTRRGGKREDSGGDQQKEKRKRQGKVFLASSDIH
jgi:hypothetical protein